MDIDTAYENGAFIPGGDGYPAKWEAAAQRWRDLERDAGRARLNVPYGKGDRQQFDIFFPSGKPAGLVQFIHGGYWRAFDRKSWSHFAAGATQRGWAVAMPSYTLAPQARISEITQEMRLALQVAAEKVSGPIVLSGHSAGGHLASRLLCADVGVAGTVSKRVARCVTISPVADLRPLMHTAMNADLQLDESEAAAESPILNNNVLDVPVTVWVGSEERPALLDQARGLSEAWDNAQLHIAPGRHHFDVIEELEEKESSLMNALLGER